MLFIFSESKESNDSKWSNVLIAGSIPPLQTSYSSSKVSKDLDGMRSIYRKIAKALNPYVDFFLCETFTTYVNSKKIIIEYFNTNNPTHTHPHTLTHIHPHTPHPTDTYTHSHTATPTQTHHTHPTHPHTHTRNTRSRLVFWKANFNCFSDVLLAEFKLTSSLFVSNQD